MPAAIPIESHSAKHDGRECIVSLFSTEIVLEFSNSTIEPIILAEKDLFCVTELPGSGLVLHSFPFVQSGMLWWKKSARTRQDLMIELNNIHRLSSFVTKIRCMILGKPISDQPLKPPRYYVIINPAGGTGVANTIYEQIVRPIFMLVQAELVEFVSDRRGSVPQELKTAQLTGFDAIVTISGDGTIHEVLNGLMSRPDWKEIVQIPLGCVPGGSGNALAHTTGLKTPLDAALSIVKGKTQPLDVCSIVQSNRRFFSFLTISWAIASDVDIESEVLRWMGDLRFTLWAVYRMIFLRRYHGKLEFISKDTQNYQASGSDVEEGLSAQTPAAGDYWPSLKYIGPYAQPSSWTTLQDRYTFFMASNVTHQNKDMITTPKANISDGGYDLCFVRACSRWNLLAIFLDVETGAHVAKYPRVVDYHKVKAFRLELDPAESAYGHLAIDGEHFPYESFQCEVHPSLWRVFKSANE